MSWRTSEAERREISTPPNGDDEICERSDNVITLSFAAVREI